VKSAVNCRRINFHGSGLKNTLIGVSTAKFVPLGLNKWTEVLFQSLLKLN
jgi:hypothetical protein